VAPIHSRNKSAKEYVVKFDEFLLDAVPSVRKGMLKSFLGLEPDLKKTCELNCYLEESPN